MKYIGYTLTFVAEVLAFFAYGLAGFSSHLPTAVRYLIGIGLPMLVITFWAVFMAPRSEMRLKQPLYSIIKFLVYAGAVVALVVSHNTSFAKTFAILAIVSEIMLFISGDSRTLSD